MGEQGLQPRHAQPLEELRSYHVDTAEGAVGVLDGVERDESGRPTSLVVAQGWFGRHRLDVSLEHLVGIDHSSRRIELAEGAAPIERGLLHRVGATRAPVDRVPGARSATRRVTRRPVLCGIDDRRRSREVMAVSVGLARHLGAPVVVCLSGGTEAGDGLLQALVDGAAEGGVDIRRVTGSGRADGIVTHAIDEEARLVVIGSPAEGMRCEVRDRVIAHAPCPVVVVPPLAPTGAGR